MIDTGGPAFPFVFDDTATLSRQIYTGMSIRDYFAAKAMQAILNDAEIFWEGAAPLAYQYADAMLKERSK